jgi:uncharacterized repeat protein (TIGR01451 family)
MSIKLMFKLVIPIVLATNLAIGFAVIVSTSTQATPDNHFDGRPLPLYSASDLSDDEESPLVAVKTASVEAAHPGEVIAYTITLTNTSDVDVENVSMTDYLADGLTELSSLEWNYGEASFAQRTVSWSGTVLTDTPAVISYLAEIAKGAEGEIINTASVSDETGDFETDPVVVKVLPNIRFTFLPMVVH